MKQYVTTIQTRCQAFASQSTARYKPNEIWEVGVEFEVELLLQERRSPSLLSVHL